MLCEYAIGTRFLQKLILRPCREQKTNYSRSQSNFYQHVAVNDVLLFDLSLN